MKFVLEIEIGNEAMTSRGDVGRTLQKIGEHLNSQWESGIGETFFDERPVHDDNGNRVGSWHFKK